jgi:L-alanine-DL-glutamate epimerase-like enolase superfamily enzyme
MKITAAESFILEVPIGGVIADSMQSVSKLEFVGLTIQTDDGISGTGYTVTVGHGGRVIQAVLDTLYIPELPGQDPFDVKDIWRQLYYGKAHWIGRAGATTMAQSAVDIALWDILAKAAKMPLWQLLGGARPAEVPIYNTHAGWLNYSVEQLVEEAARLLDQGYPALKAKVGLPDTDEDVRRIETLRRSIPDDILLMVDANQTWDLMQARRAARKLGELDLAWLEEPMHPDDIDAHRLLGTESTIPIALGEHVYTTHAFRDYIAAYAVDVVQVDVCRVGGITPWLEVAALADAANLRVCPHAGDLMQVHQHLVKAIPNSWMLEVIPIWEKGPFQHQIRLADGVALNPMEPGASSDFTAGAFDRFRIA